MPAEDVSHAAHLGGGISGLLVGLVVIRNLRAERCERIIIYISLFLALFWTIFSLAWLYSQSTGPRSIWEAMAGEPAWCWHKAMMDHTIQPYEWRCVRCGTESCVKGWLDFNATESEIIGKPRGPSGGEIKSLLFGFLPGASSRGVYQEDQRGGRNTGATPEERAPKVSLDSPAQSSDFDENRCNLRFLMWRRRILRVRQLCEAKSGQLLGDPLPLQTRGSFSDPICRPMRVLCRVGPQHVPTLGAAPRPAGLPESRSTQHGSGRSWVHTGTSVRPARVSIGVLGRPSRGRQ